VQRGLQDEVGAVVGGFLGVRDLPRVLLLPEALPMGLNLGEVIRVNVWVILRSGGEICQERTAYEAGGSDRLGAGCD
jgi:hypothetical protein